MQSLILTLLASLPLVLCTPLGAAETSMKRDFAYEQLTFTFYGAAASYQLSFPADGQSHPTNNDLNIDLVDPGSFNAHYLCNFYYPTGDATPTLTQVSDESLEFTVGPPAPVSSVACNPTGQNGTCLPVYADCEFCTVTAGCFVGDCCSGYCAATKCRPT